MEVGKHKYALECETLYDKAALSYAKKLEEGTSSLQYQSPDHDVCQALHYTEPLAMGWALKTSATRRRLTDTQKEYLIKYFDIGEQTGHKADPVNVASLMRKARKADGTLLFETSEFLTSRQISSFFSRLAKKRRAGGNIETNDIEEEESDFIEQLNEEQFHELTDEVMSEISILHPILYERYNICELTLNSSLCTNTARNL